MKLFVTDLDGTLYPKKEVSHPNQFEDNLKAVHKWIEQGNKFAVATARGIHHYEVLCKKIGLAPIFIGANGAQIRYENGEVIAKTIPISIFIDLCKLITQHQINASVATGINKQWVWSSKDCYPLDCEVKPPYINDVVVMDVKDIDITLGTERIQIFVSKEKRDELRAFLESQNYPVTITTSDVDLIDIGPLNSSKGIAIEEICHHYGIAKENLVVAGDSENDITMFEVTDHSYCIDHAEPDVLNSAKHTVASVEEIIKLEI